MLHMCWDSGICWFFDHGQRSHFNNFEKKLTFEIYLNIGVLINTFVSRVKWFSRYSLKF